MILAGATSCGPRFWSAPAWSACARVLMAATTAATPVVALGRSFVLVPVCPEQLGGLPTPREPAEIQGGDGREALAGRCRVATITGGNVTAAFARGAGLVVAVARLVGARGRRAQGAKPVLRRPRDVRRQLRPVAARGSGSGRGGARGRRVSAVDRGRRGRVGEPRGERSSPPFGDQDGRNGGWRGTHDPRKSDRSALRRLGQPPGRQADARAGHRGRGDQLRHALLHVHGSGVPVGGAGGRGRVRHPPQGGQQLRGAARRGEEAAFRLRARSQPLLGLPHPRVPRGGGADGGDRAPAS